MKSTNLRWLDRLRMRWQSLRHRHRLDDELGDELQFHLDQLTASYRAQGLDRAEAQRRARLEMGGLAQISEATRDERGWHRTDQFLRDTRLAFRTFRTHPGFTLTALLTIGVAIGANTALYTAMRAVLSKPLPVADAKTLRNIHVMVERSTSRASYNSSSFASFRELARLRNDARTADIAGIAEAEVSWSGLAGGPVRAQLVSDNLLPMMGSRPVMGRFFRRAETAEPGSAAVVILSHRFWQRRLGGDPAIVGASVLINRRPFTVIGVADSASRGPLIRTAEIWMPVTMQAATRAGPSLVDDPNVAWIQIFARARPGATDATVEAEAEVLAAQVLAEADTAGRVQAIVVPAAFLNLPKVRRVSFPALALVWLAVSMILVVACANVANMLLARGISRQREIAIRLAIGAGRRRLVAQLLTESGWLGLLGGLVGLGLAYGIGRVATGLAPESAGLQLDLSPDRVVLFFTAAVSILSALIFGLLPALQSTRLDLTPGLKAEGMLVAGRPRSRAQQTLVAVQVGVCVLLLLNAGLLLRSFGRALTMETGRSLDHVAIASFDLRQQQYTAQSAEVFLHQVRSAMLANPSVEHVGISYLEIDRARGSDRAAVADSLGAPGELFQTGFDRVDAGYFAATGLATLAGRTFTEQEVRTRAPVAVVDQRFANERLGGRAVGRRVWLSSGPGERTPHDVIGVVAINVPLGIDARHRPTYYTPISGDQYLEARLHVRYRGEAGPMLAAVRTAAAGVDGHVTPSLRTIEDNVRTALMPFRIISAGLAALGGLALLLAATGLFGVIGFSVGRRRREIAVRMALGAGTREVVGLVTRQAMSPVAAGLGGGLVVAGAAGYLIRSLLHGISPLDPVAILLVLVAIGTAAGLACVVPAQRAASVRPAAVLRVD